GFRDEPGRTGERHDVRLAGIAASVLDAPQEVAHMENADDVLGRAPPQRNTRHRPLENGLDDLLGRLAHVRGDDLGAVDHDIRNGEVAQVQEPAEHVAVLLSDDAFLVQQIDSAAQAFVTGQQRLAGAGYDAGNLQDPVDDPVRRVEHGP